MTSIKTMQDLQDRIKVLESLEASQLLLLRSNANIAAQSLRPSSLLKNALGDVTGSSTIRKEAIKAGIGIGTGMLMKRMFTGASSVGIFKKAAGLGLQFLTTKMVSGKISKLKKKITS